MFHIYKKHHEILKHYGLEIINSNNNNWANSPNVYVLVAESVNTGEMIGGARIHIANKDERLPIEVESELGKGATFTISLPIKKAN